MLQFFKQQRMAGPVNSVPNTQEKLYTPALTSSFHGSNAEKPEDG